MSGDYDEVMRDVGDVATAMNITMNEPHDHRKIAKQLYDLK
jgi:hypothetical protein